MQNAGLHNSKGMTLIEVLIGMIIGLIGIVVITQVYLVNENFKRTTTSAGSAQINGSIALYSLERDILTAGYGISDSRALACGPLRYFYNSTYSSPPGPAAGALQSIRVAPVVITDGGTNPDTIAVMYASSEARAVPATISINMSGAAANLRLDNVTGFSSTPGDLIMVAGTTDCTLMQVTSVVTGTLELGHASAAALWNPVSGGSFTTYNAGAQVFNLGKPTVNIYSVSSNALRQLRVFTWPAANVAPSYNSTAQTLVDDIVDMKAEYGKDTSGTADGIIDAYDKVLPADADAWKRVLAVRVGVLARSQNYEKPESGTTCTATTVAPTWSGGSFTVPGGLPSCYKYKVFETVIPLRNMLWSRS